MTSRTTVDSAAAVAAKDLKASMRGSVITPADEEYGAAKALWNGAIDRRPSLIARCEDAEDVQLALAAAQGHGLAVSVRGGAHDWAGRALCDGGLVVDLSAMRAVTVDAGNFGALAEGGATAGDLVAAARPHGLAPVTGTVRAVGMAGLTLAGGYGPLCGKHGLALDNLIGAEVVLADGKRVTASEQSDPDLLWALRGGGGGIGVVVAARYRLHPLDSVVAGILLFPLAQAADVLRGYAELIAVAPDELTVATGFLSGPDGEPVLFLSPTWSGEPAGAKEALGRIRALGEPLVDHVSSLALEEALGAFDEHVIIGRHYGVRTRSLARFSDEAAAIMIAAARAATSPLSAIAVHHFHGTAARVPAEATAFGLRQDHLMVEIVAAWEPTTDDDGSTHMQWANALSDELSAEALPGGYPNLLGPDEPERVRLAYGSNLNRLTELRLRYDPDGVFASAIGRFDEQPRRAGETQVPNPPMNKE